MRVTAEQIAIISAVIDESNITIETLRDDVLDHLCCAVEIEMARGKDFETALREAVEELSPDGLNEIQHETVFLLNSTKIIHMKKVMYGIGLLSAMAFVLGWGFGLLHLPGATQLSVYGFSSFAFIFLPLLAIDHFKTNIRRTLSDKLKFILGFASGILVGLSGVFKVMHLQGTVALLVAGILLCVFGFFPFLFFTMYKKSIT